MEMNFFLDEIMKANFHKGGIKCLTLFRVKDDFFKKLRDEVVLLSKMFTPSDVTNPTHISHSVTRPYGENYQYSLFNKSGACDDFSTDWNRCQDEKKFHFESNFPALARFIHFFHGRTNMKLLVLGPHSGLFPHEAHLMKREVSKDLLLRFHLPIITNYECEMLLDNEYFRFEKQYIYFFNEGCIHSAYNHGDTARYHLSWDIPFSPPMFNQMFSDSDMKNDLLERMIGEKKFLQPHRRGIIKDYNLQGKGKLLYDRLALKRLAISQSRFNFFYNNLNYLYYQFKKKSYFTVNKNLFF